MVGTLIPLDKLSGSAHVSGVGVAPNSSVKRRHETPHLAARERVPGLAGVSAAPMGLRVSTTGHRIR